MDWFNFEAERRMIKVRELISNSKKKKSKLEKEEIPRDLKQIKKCNITYTDHFITQLKNRFNKNLGSNVKASIYWRLQQNYRWWNIYRVRDKNHKTRFAIFSKTKKYIFDYIDGKFTFVTVINR